MTTSFTNKSKSLLPMSKETVRKVWDLSIQASMAAADRHGVPFIPPAMPIFGKSVTVLNFQQYMIAITGNTACPICNGPRGYRGFPPSIGCLFFPSHAVITNGRATKENWEMYLGPLCDHGYYKVECKECVASEVERIFKATSGATAYVQ